MRCRNWNQTGNKNYERKFKISVHISNIRVISHSVLKKLCPIAKVCRGLCPNEKKKLSIVKKR